MAGSLLRSVEIYVAANILWRLRHFPTADPGSRDVPSRLRSGDCWPYQPADDPLDELTDLVEKSKAGMRTNVDQSFRVVNIACIELFRLSLDINNLLND
jgi:hypothetical protein